MDQKFSVTDPIEIIWAGTTITDARAELKHNFGVAVSGEKIIAVGDRDHLRNQFPTAGIVGSQELLLAPGMVNSHDHGRAIDPVFLGVDDDLLEVWLTQLSSLPSIDPYLAAAYDGIRLISSGVTTVAHSHNPLNWENLPEEAAATIKGYRDVGIRVAFHPPIVDQNLLVYDDVDNFLSGLPLSVKELALNCASLPPLSKEDYFNLCTELFNVYDDTQSYTVRIQVSPAGGQWCSDELILAAVDFAQQKQTKVQMHLLETRYQSLYAHRHWGKSFIKHLEEIGALGPWLTCAHMVWLEPEDILLLANSQVGIAHNPSSNLRLRSGIAPISNLIAAGAKVGIGLDGLGLHGDQDYLGEMVLAWTLSNYQSSPNFSLDAQTVWEMATSTGVEITMGPEAPLGRLTEGYLADLVLFEWSDRIGWLRNSDSNINSLLARFLREVKRQHIKQVMVGGRWVFQEGRSLNIDEKDIQKNLWEKIACSWQPEKNKQTPGKFLAPYIRRFYSQW